MRKRHNIDDVDEFKDVLASQSQRRTHDFIRNDVGYVRIIIIIIIIMVMIVIT